MADLVITERENLVSIANQIRTLTGETEQLSLDDMDLNLQTANTEKENMITALEEMGVVVEDGASLGDIADLITTVETGVDTSDATAEAGDILSGKTAYVGSGKVTGTIAFQPAKTITPSATSQIAVSSGYYAGGDITIAGDANLVAGNIKSGVSIFGVAGSYEGSGSGGNTDIEDGFITREITTYTNNRVTTIGNYAFYSYSSLTSVNFPACTTIGSYAFYSCTSLTSVNFPACTTINGSAFCKCSNLKSLYLMGSSLCRLSNSNAFTSTPIGGYSASAGTYGSIYVPASLLTSYKTATNWTYFSSRFVGI